MKSLTKSMLYACLGSAMAASTAFGAFTFTNGDLILGVQATGGTGATQNVFFNLGSGVYHRDNPGYNFGVATNGNNPFGTTGQTQIGNIGATLTLVYGANWYSRSDVYFGVIGNLNAQPTSGFGSTAAVAGDPSRTFYLSTPTTAVGGGLLVAPNSYAPATLGGGGTTLSGLEANLPGFTTQGDGAAILSQTTQPTEWNNSWSVRNPVPGASFVFFSSIQQNFGQGGTETLVDLQRVLSTNTGASPTGVAGGGTYETTFGIGSNGAVFAIPEPSTSLLGLAAGMIFAFRRRRA